LGYLEVEHTFDDELEELIMDGRRCGQIRTRDCHTFMGFEWIGCLGGE
jgi:hypothetical protein